VCAGHQAAEFSDERLNLFFTLVGPTLAPVGEDLALVGKGLAPVGFALALVGFALALVGLALALVGPTLALVGFALALVGADLTYVGLMLTSAQVLDWPRWCLAVAFHVLKDALVWRGPARRGRVRRRSGHGMALNRVRRLQSKTHPLPRVCS